MPAEVTATFTDTVDGTFTTKTDDVEARGHVAHVRPVDRRGDQPGEHGHAGKFSTPTVLINGKQFSGAWQTPGALKQAVEAAKS